MQITVIENQSGMTSDGEFKPYVTGVSKVSGVESSSPKRMVSTINYTNIGMRARATAHVTPEGPLALELDIEDSRAPFVKTARLLALMRKAIQSGLQVITHALVTTTVTLQSGHAVLLKDVKTTSKSGQERTIIIAGARIIGDEAKAKDKLPAKQENPKNDKPGGQGDKASQMQPLPAELVAAWKEAGARVGWMSSASPVLLFREGGDGKKGEIPAFRVQIREWTPGMLASLPQPQTAFGLDLGTSRITNAGLKELAGLKNLQMLGLFLLGTWEQQMRA